jgi:putative alpha-1,2-mannosidase
MYPMRNDYIDDQVSWFPMSIISHRQGELFGIKPVNGSITEESWNQKLAYDHDLENKSPWQYSAWLPVDEIQVDFAPGARSGMYRFEFNSIGFSLLFKTIQSGSFDINEDGDIEGTEEFMGMKAFVYGILQSSGEAGSDLLTKSPEENSPTIGHAWVIYENPSQKTVLFKYGISFISIDQAKQNLEREIPDWDFDALAKAGQAIWEKEIDQINVKGGTDAQRRTFYTALYRTKERMIDINEYGKYYSAYDHQVHESDKPFYADDWVWDTYLAHHPLRMILYPDQEAEMLQSYALMYQQSGCLAERNQRI